MFIMKKTSSSSQTKSLVLKTFLFSLFLSLTFLFFLLSDHQPSSSSSSHHHKTTHPPPPTTKPPDLRIRPGFTTYDSYIQHQLNKTLNPKLRRLWLTRDWDRKIDVFSKFFTKLKHENFLSNDSKALCIGARVGQEVAALKRVGVADSIGIDLVPYPPLVMQGDFHDQPFENSTFDFEFSNVFDHALYPTKFVGEIERTLKPGGVCVLHVALSGRGDKYSANDLYNVGGLVGMFRVCEVVHVRKVDGFGLDTEVVFRKKKMNNYK
ncbi:Methyltransferase type 11 [Macleaya cordata]|uniref:Methyltransferase type 11 n=1 Tax=Macleaya cordata TaxID=56857 RepID=A0A200R4I3_MACCD|nr:Methyltransferase type 11 [Macleaya cordata]